MKFNRSRIVALSFLLPVFFAALFYACSSSGTITATADPESRSSLAAGDDIVVTFSDSVDPDSLELGGNMADEADEATWSSDNTVLAIKPASSWDTSVAGTLTIDVNDKDGKAVDTVDLEYTVTIALTKFQSAKVVIGQTDFNNQSSGTTSSKFSAPYGNAGFGDGKLILPDWSNNRTLVFNSIPTANGVHAHTVIGQADFTSSGAGNNADESGGPVTVQVYKGKLFVLDYGNNDLRIYNTIPTSSGAEADVVVGHPSFGSSSSDCTATKMASPESFMIVDDKLIVADSDNNRVLIWNSIPTTNGQAADLVLGQHNFTTCQSNDDDQDGVDDGPPSQRTLYFPTGIWSDGTKLVVGDESNNRVLIWNEFPTTNFKKANVVLGQADFTHNAANDDDQDGSSDSNPTSRTLYDPYDGIASNGTQLFVADSSNNRILIWNTFPTENFERADNVLGQNSYTTGEYDDLNQDGSNDATASAKTFDYPAGLLLVGNQLIVTDESNNRYMIFNGQ